MSHVFILIESGLTWLQHILQADPPELGSCWCGSPSAAGDQHRLLSSVLAAGP